MAHRILLAEDEESIRATLKLNLEMEGYHVTVCPDGKEALKSFRGAHFDLVILDVMMPGLDGFSVCEAIRVENNRVPVLFLTARFSADDKVHGLKIGADDYITKPFNLEEFLLRVGNLIRRGSSEPATGQGLEGVFRFGDFEIDFQTYRVKGLKGKHHELSKREIQLLKFLTDREGEVVSREDILKTVWGLDVFPTTRTIDNYILTFRKIFEKNPRNPVHFHSIRGVGYKFTS
jgi:two-component system, OmpR family, alkaline phosphatase synthesis response regulator PhoP